LFSEDHAEMTCLKNIVSYVLKDEYVRLSGLIETILPCTTPEIFTLRKKYTIVEAINDSYGKWPNQLGNGWFTDS
jgi:ABC-type antimicrobial peptide transport system permease subunit